MLAQIGEGLWTGLMRIGLPVVASYHLMTNHAVFNTSFENATGLERISNRILAPAHYLFAGKLIRVSEQNPGCFQITQRFEYQNHFILKSTLSLATLPMSVLVGGGLKWIVVNTSDCKKKHVELNEYMNSLTTISNQEYYESIGIALSAPESIEWLDSPIYERNAAVKEHLKEQKEALREMIALLNEHKIPYWVDCGTLLGTFRYRGVIPWDDDIDIAVLLPDFQNLMHVLNGLSKEKYAVQDWSSRDRPGTYVRVYVREKQGHIDIFHFAIHEKRRSISSVLSYENSWFMSESWKNKERPFTVETPISMVFPLKKSIFDGMEVCVPNETEKYLQLRYGEDLRPAKIFNPLTGRYEKDEMHPYWQRTSAH